MGGTKKLQKIVNKKSKKRVKKSKTNTNKNAFCTSIRHKSKSTKIRTNTKKNILSQNKKIRM